MQANKMGRGIIVTTALLLAFAVQTQADEQYPQEMWQSHQKAMQQTSGLTHYYTFDDLRPEQVASKNAKTQNLVKPNEFFEYKTNQPFELVQGEFPDKKAVRLDAGWFEAPAFLPNDNAFSVEVRFRKNGPGTLTGNNGSKSGTIIGMGDGYWSGMRVTTDTSRSHQPLHFSIGRPQPSSAITISSHDPAYDSLWSHLTVTWDGQQMRIYIDGIISNVGEYKGDFAPANWGLRLGFNNAGVGSLDYDVEELAVFNRVLMPDEIFAHATFSTEQAKDLGDKFNAWLCTMADILMEQRKSNIKLSLEEFMILLQKAVTSQKTVSEDYVKSAPLASGMYLLFVCKLLHPNDAQETFKFLLSPDQMPESIRKRVLFSYIPNDSTVPTLRLSSAEYKNMLRELGGLSQNDKQRIEQVAKIAETFEKAMQAKQTVDNAIVFEPIKPREIFEPGFAPSVRFYVSPNGKATNSGSEQSPFATLEQARDAIRKLRADNNDQLPKGGVEVLVRGGLYPIRTTIAFDESDTGTSDAPIVYRNFAGETPLFCGGVNLTTLAKSQNKPAFQKVTDAAVLGQLPETVRGQLMVADLAALGVDDDIVPIRPRGYGRSGAGAAPWFEVYVNGKPQQIARYPNYTPDSPNDCFLKTGSVLDGNMDKPNQAKPGIFEYDHERINRWAGIDDVWLFGYWAHLWAANSHPIKTIDVAKKQIVMATPSGYGFRENMPFYAFNLLCEIDTPGEWYFDRQAKRLYILPPIDENNRPVDLNAVDVDIPIFAGPIIKCDNLSYVVFFGLTMTDCAGTAFQANGGEQLLVAGCTFERLGCWAVAMHNGRQNGTYGCDMRWLGGGGVAISGGNVRTLERGDCFIENCTVQYFTLVDRVYAPAASIDGVGNRIAHNLFEDSPHHGMRMGGYDHTVEYNRINRVVQESDDQSGIDMWGDPVCRGNVIRYNYWSNIGNKWDVAGQSGIRLDDMISGILMYGNIFVRSAGGRFGAIQIHGGKDNIAENNLIIDSQAAFSFSPWGKNRWLENLVPESHFWKRSTIEAGIDPMKSPHIDRYPDLSELPENADRNFIRGNIAFVTKEFAFNDHGQNEMADNIAIDQVALNLLLPDNDWFRANEDGTKITLPPRNSGFYRIMQFEPLPYEQMGNYTDERLPNR